MPPDFIETFSICFQSKSGNFQAKPVLQDRIIEVLNQDDIMEAGCNLYYGESTACPQYLHLDYLN